MVYSGQDIDYTSLNFNCLRRLSQTFDMSGIYKDSKNIRGCQDLRLLPMFAVKAALWNTN